MYVDRAVRNVEMPNTTEVTVLSAPTAEGQTRPISIIFTCHDTGRLIITLDRANLPRERLFSVRVTQGDIFEFPNAQQYILEAGDAIKAKLAETPSRAWQVSVDYEWQDFGAPSLAARFTFANSEFLEHADDALLDTGDIDFEIWAICRIDGITADRVILAKWTSASKEYRLIYKTSDSKVYLQVSNDGTALIEIETTLTVSASVFFQIFAYHDSVNNLIGISLNNATFNTAAHTTGVLAASNTFRVGADGDGNYLEGVVSSAAIWKRRLTAAERTWLYNNGLGRDPRDFGFPTTDGRALSVASAWSMRELSTGAGPVTRTSLLGTLDLTDNATVVSIAGVPK